MRRKIITLLLFLVTQSTTAELVYYDTYVHDTTTNLDWLKVSLTDGMSALPLNSSVSRGEWGIADGNGPGVSPGSIFAPFIQEIEIYRNYYPYIPLPEPTESINEFIRLVEFLTGEVYSGSGSFGVSAAAYDQNAGGGCSICYNWYQWNIREDMNGFYTDSSSTLGYYTEYEVLNQEPWFAEGRPPRWWVVREHIVPLPAPIWLFLSALCGMASLKH